MTEGRPSVARMTTRHVDVVVRAAPDAVYAFARDPANLPRWASGLATSAVERTDDDALVVDSPMGRVVVRFAPLNAFGVLDHDVELPTGGVTSNPMRVLAHPDGAEVVFTLRQGAASDEDFERDAATVAADLRALKALVEG
jgi:hypothetical protein